MIFKYRGDSKDVFHYNECDSITVSRAAPRMDETTEGEWSKERQENQFMLMADIFNGDDEQHIIFWDGFLMEHGKTIERFSYGNIKDYEE